MFHLPELIQDVHVAATLAILPYLGVKTLVLRSLVVSPSLAECSCLSWALMTPGNQPVMETHVGLTCSLCCA